MLVRESNLNIRIYKECYSLKVLFYYSIFPDVPLHFHFETLFKKTEIKGDLAENKFVGDCVISPSPGMSFTNLVLYMPFISFRYCFCFLRK